MGVKLSMKRLRLWGAVTLIAAQGCGDGGGAKPAPLGDGPDVFDEMDAGRDAGARRDAGADAGASLGPLIEVLTPTATDDPSSEDVVVGSTLTVRCSIAKNPKGEAVDPKTTKVMIYAGEETKPAITQVATSTSDADVFQAENINLTDLAHGPIRIECSGSDVATKVQSSSTSIYTLYDAGPKITFVNPKENGFVSVGDGKMGTDVVVRFRVEPQPLADQDPGAEIAEITALVGGKPISNIEASSTEENTYSFPLDFSDTALFITIPKTLSLRIDATNAREPKGRTTSASLAVGVDSEGPTITVKSPARINNQKPVVSGKVDVVLEVKDALAGVNRSSVQIQIKPDVGDPVTYRAEAAANDLYNVSFDTGSFPGKPGLTITLLATDNVGISAESSLAVDVDTVPPWISLDPPTVRELTRKSTGNECSGTFDPLGDAVNEGVVIGDAYRVRALIWDRPLTATMQTSSRYAMIDNATPRLYIQHNTAVPLLIDTDGDHECDKVNTGAEQTPTTIVLSPVKPAGTAIPAGTWTMMSTTYVFEPEDFSLDPYASACAKSIAANYGSPLPVSADTTMTRVIKHVVPGDYAAVYADSPTSSGVRSTGADYFPPPGWACLVAVAKDNAGNFAFSAPMRVCAQREGYVCESSPPASLTCTDGCAIPAKFARDAANAMPRVIEYTAM